MGVGISSDRRDHTSKWKMLGYTRTMIDNQTYDGGTVIIKYKCRGIDVCRMWAATCCYSKACFASLVLTFPSMFRIKIHVISRIKIISNIIIPRQY